MAYGAAALLALVVVAVAGDGVTAPTRPRPVPDARRHVPRLSTGRLVLLSAGAALATWAAVALSITWWQPRSTAASPKSAAGLLLFAGSAASIAGRLAAGAVTDRVAGRGFGAMAVLTGAGALVFPALPFASGAVSALVVPAAFATGWGWPGLMTYLVVNADAATPASWSSTTQAGIFVGAGLGPLVLGWVVDAGSFDAMWLVMVGGVGRAATT